MTVYLQHDAGCLHLSRRWTLYLINEFLVQWIRSGRFGHKDHLTSESLISMFGVTVIGMDSSVDVIDPRNSICKGTCCRSQIMWSLRTLSVNWILFMETVNLCAERPRFSKYPELYRVKLLTGNDPRNKVRMWWHNVIKHPVLMTPDKYDFSVVLRTWTQQRKERSGRIGNKGRRKVR